MRTILGNRFRWNTCTRLTINRLSQRQLERKPRPLFIKRNANGHTPRLIQSSTNIRIHFKIKRKDSGVAFPRPCLDCGALTSKGNRCQPHQTAYQARLDTRRKPNRKHYSNDYKKRAKQVRESAQQCWICKEGYKPNDPFTADHLLPSDPNSPLAAAHRSCNSRRQNKPITSN